MTAAATLAKKALTTEIVRPSVQNFLGHAGSAIAAALRANDLESALSALTRLAYDGVGDHDAGTIPGRLKPGERDYRVSGVFLITPDRKYNMLVANQGFPPEQRRLCIPVEWNHPGEVVRTEAPILLENTDDHAQFRQFLKTSRMGSSLYHPIVGPYGMVGQIVVAAQARQTYNADDVSRMRLIAEAAALVWENCGGTEWLASDYPPPDAWRAEEHA